MARPKILTFANNDQIKSAEKVFNPAGAPMATAWRNPARFDGKQEDNVHSVRVVAGCHRFAEVMAVYPKAEVIELHSAESEGEPKAKAKPKAKGKA